ncbi:hypothetical protein ACIBCR_27475 [Micromonospora echinospora]|uniref:hypothetical protein n=1 Tax=Micromonospora echinospora TaxID=1877 RepID=UPI0037ABB0E8
MTSDDASPFFIAPHRFDATGAADQPVLDRHHEPVPEPGERVLARHRLTVAGHLLGPALDRRQWSLAPTATVTVTDRRIVHVCGDLALAPVDAGPRHRRRTIRPASGQIRWQWPSRLELRPTAPDGSADLLVVCDALRTIAQPALALGGPAREIATLARLVRRAVAAFRLANPTLVELSVAERDVLLRRAGTGSVVRGTRVTLPGSLPVEFLSRDDYYHPGSARPRRSRAAGRPAAGQPGPAC